MPYGPKGIAGTSSGLIDHCMGRHLPSVGVLYQAFLLGKLRILIKIIKSMEMNPDGRPSTINFTYRAISFKKKKKLRKTRKERRRERRKRSLIKKTAHQYIFGASVRSGTQTNTLTKEMIYENNKLIADSRVERIPALQWCQSNVVLTKEESENLKHPWGNCAESVPWWVNLCGQQTNRQHHVVLYSRTVLTRGKVEKVIPPCTFCRKVKNRMKDQMHVKIRSC